MVIVAIPTPSIALTVQCTTLSSKPTKGGEVWLANDSACALAGVGPSATWKTRQQNIANMPAEWGAVSYETNECCGSTFPNEAASQFPSACRDLGLGCAAAEQDIVEETT